MAAVQLLAAEERGDTRKLVGGDGDWRLRVGDWRVIFKLDRDAARLTILRVLPRGRAYRD